jgi:hypothetical protein
VDAETGKPLIASNMECHMCPDIFVLVLIFFVGGIAGLAGLIYLVYSNRQDAKDDKYKHGNTMAIFAKMVLSSMQMNSIALAFAFDWDALAEGMLYAQSEVCLDFLAAWLLVCIVSRILFHFRKLFDQFVHLCVVCVGVLMGTCV